LTPQKDDPRAVEFQALFATLAQRGLGSAEQILQAASSDREFYDICQKISLLYMEISSISERGANLFVGPVDPALVKSWRDYERSYASAINHLSLCELVGADTDEIPFKPGSNLSTMWKYADARGAALEIGVDKAVAFMEERLEDDAIQWPENYAEELQDGLSGLRQLTTTTLCLRGVFRRRQMVPMVLIPRQVSNHYGENEKLSMQTHLRQAHDAFIYDAPFASIALLRSLMEVVLQKHYASKEENADSCDLKDLIDAAIGLPKSVHPGRLQRLRKLANSILHFGNRGSVLPDSLEQGVIDFMLAVRDLIEGATR
jgi:hypothetical protein